MEDTRCLSFANVKCFVFVTFANNLEKLCELTALFLLLAVLGSRVSPTARLAWRGSRWRPRAAGSSPRVTFSTSTFGAACAWTTSTRLTTTSGGLRAHRHRPMTTTRWFVRTSPRTPSRWCIRTRRGRRGLLRVISSGGSSHEINQTISVRLLIQQTTDTNVSQIGSKWNTAILRMDRGLYHLERTYWNQPRTCSR